MGQLTSEQIDRIVPGRDFDRQIAHVVVGLKPCTFHTAGGFSAWATMWQCNHKTTLRCYPTNSDAIHHVHSPLLHYSTDIFPAWIVVERLRKVFWLRLTDMQDTEYLATFTESVGPDGSEQATSYQGIGSGPSEAICRAGYKAAVSEAWQLFSSKDEL